MLCLHAKFQQKILTIALVIAKCKYLTFDPFGGGQRGWGKTLTLQFLFEACADPEGGVRAGKVRTGGGVCQTYMHFKQAGFFYFLWVSTGTWQSWSIVRSC